MSILISILPSVLEIFSLFLSNHICPLFLFAATWKEVFDNTNNKMQTRTLTGVFLQTIQQLSGINAIMFYAPTIFADFFGEKGGIYGALALNVINFFSTFICMATIEKCKC